MRIVYHYVASLFLFLNATAFANSNDPFAERFGPGRTSISAWLIFPGSDGESHLKSIEMSVAEKDFFGVQNGLKKYFESHPDHVQIFSAPGGIDLPWHTTPRKEMFITLRGSSTLILGDGTRKDFGSGEIVIFEDNVGRGHAGKTGPEGYTAINIDLGIIEKK
jgi:hypothetical protein